MTRLKPEQRRQMANMVRKGLSKKVVAEIFGVSRVTVWTWCKRAKHRGRESFRDRPRRPKRGKVTGKVESSIVELRLGFGWGTARIQQALVNLPKFMREKLTVCVQRVRLSRTSINGVLGRYGLNGYERETKAWKFFRAKREDELWQLDVKGPFTVLGQKCWFPVCVDDYSRYLLVCERFGHEPTTEELTRLLEGLPRKPGRSSRTTAVSSGKSGSDGAGKTAWNPCSRTRTTRRTRERSNGPSGTSPRSSSTC